MARIILGSYMVRYPLGGMMSWVLQYLVGFQRLGHEIWFVEKSGYPNSCFDPVQNVMSDDCRYGVHTVASLLQRFGLGGQWCYVDAAGHYHGLSRRQVEAVFSSADLFVDMGTHGAWLEEAARTRLRVLIDGEPGFTQMKMEHRQGTGGTLPQYDHYYTTGRNIGTGRSSAPTAGQAWRPIFHPVVADLFPLAPIPPNAPWTTIMNWQSYEPLRYQGAVYGHKNLEFPKFLSLPRKTNAPLEIAVSGSDVRQDELKAAGWRVRDAHEVTASFDRFVSYIGSSCGEFSVCKNGFVATRSGWFSDRSAAYLASGRPVVMQDTGFRDHLPCGDGLFAVATVEEAAAALDEIAADHRRHAQAARAIAIEHLEANIVLRGFLDDFGL